MSRFIKSGLFLVAGLICGFVLRMALEPTPHHYHPIGTSLLMYDEGTGSVCFAKPKTPVQIQVATTATTTTMVDISSGIVPKGSDVALLYPACSP